MEISRVCHFYSITTVAILLLTKYMVAVLLKVLTRHTSPLFRDFFLRTSFCVFYVFFCPMMTVASPRNPVPYIIYYLEYIQASLYTTSYYYMERCYWNCIQCVYIYRNYLNKLSYTTHRIRTSCTAVVKLPALRRMPEHHSEFSPMRPCPYQ